MITQLNPPIPLETPKGKALAHFVIDYGPEHHLMWVTFVDATGECWTWPNDKIRAQKNITMHRMTGDDKPALPPVLMDGVKANGTHGRTKPHGKNAGIVMNGAH